MWLVQRPHGNYVLDGGGPGYSHVVHVGLHVLGALAAMPERSGLVVRQGGETPFGIRPADIAVAGLQPYPADTVVTPVAPPR